MKSFISILTLALAIGLTGPTFAAEQCPTATTKAACQKLAGCVWDAKANTCSAKKM
jgi:hypothetical protein